MGGSMKVRRRSFVGLDFVVLSRDFSGLNRDFRISTREITAYFRYDFFQTLSVIGGVVVVCEHGSRWSER